MKYNYEGELKKFLQPGEKVKWSEEGSEKVRQREEKQSFSPMSALGAAGICLFKGAAFLAQIHTYFLATVGFLLMIVVFFVHLLGFIHIEFIFYLIAFLFLLGYSKLIYSWVKINFFALNEMYVLTDKRILLFKMKNEELQLKKELSIKDVGIWKVCGGGILSFSYDCRSIDFYVEDANEVWCIYKTLVPQEEWGVFEALKSEMGIK
ncbi:hypothetical protein SAMN05192551_10512 [Tindallia magadiensis]|uniref:Uncharacterized protein n=1 Tax=Tindallia magadiensis TaxID=69895 RepID=A0A1I3EHW3_9FIRM|nr:hypothetical protein [Tindallia magadiensis]SFH98546.1 hypothetical protein SAMN05192551_10512 [Tindallia magadiensis]